MNENDSKELVKTAKEILKEILAAFEHNKHIRVEVSSDGLVHVGFAPITIKIYEEK